MLSVSAMVLAKEAGKPQSLSTEQRLEKLERMLSSEGLIDISLKLESLENEIQRLRGEIEEQHHTIAEIKKRQRDLYIDIDRRLVQFERSGQVGVQNTAPSSASQTAAAAGAGVVAGSSTGQPSSTRTGKPTTGNRRTTTVKPVSLSEQQAYQKAFDELRELRYDKATISFRDFLKKYPDGRYAHIAQYWLGEASYTQRKFKQAIRDYQTLMLKHPNSPKVAEALLKIGYSEYELKNYASAQKSLETLIKNYPKTTEAGQAQNLLKKIKLKGRK
jgi:tol-pal system protein YbgF